MMLALPADRSGEYGACPCGDGVFEITPDDRCYCHLSAPCSYCVTAWPFCGACGEQMPDSGAPNG